MMKKLGMGAALGAFLLMTCSVRADESHSGPPDHVMSAMGHQTIQRRS